MDVVLDLQAMEGPELMDGHGDGDGCGGHGHGGHSHLSLLAACAHSTISLLGCW
ncbi:SapB/AmfS family lanthipeptide [Labedaea rhizosphaerae]|uniref:SapB/AmfS family lantipeptide n=1 Tax=Labedaea rhizosphaerae TaxID=598644 RepID=A0A4R6S9P0_LABRH|nr:SapB/AmfS family lanthipeptide [Labedaea rhizosphaerae]TDP96652.1 hypothetical protein EV186_104640 [Labedaea rhizosphaerae]